MPGDTNNVTDVFVRDMVNGTNILVSISPNGGCANGVSGESAMTPDGRYVAFASTASNLVPNDTNGIQDIFVRDLQNGTTVRASSDALAGMVPAPNGYESVASVRIHLRLRRTDVMPPLSPLSAIWFQDCLKSSGIFVSDLVAGTTTLVSSNVINVTSTGQPSSYNLAISDNGQFVAFESTTNASAAMESFNDTTFKPVSRTSCVPMQLQLQTGIAFSRIWT